MPRLLPQLFTALELAPPATAATLFHAIIMHITELGHESRRYPACLLDEASILHGHGDLFSDDAVAVLRDASQGAHRDLDRLATDGLRRAARRGKHGVPRGRRHPLLIPSAPWPTGVATRGPS